MTSITDIAAFARTIEFLSGSEDHLADDIRAARRRYLRRANGTAPAACPDTLLRKLEELAGGPLVDDGSLPVSEVDQDRAGPGDLAWCQSVIAQREFYENKGYLSLVNSFDSLHVARIKKGRVRADQRAVLNALFPNWNDAEANDADRRKALGIGQNYEWGAMVIEVVKFFKTTCEPTPERLAETEKVFDWLDLQRETLLKRPETLVPILLHRRIAKLDKLLPWWRDASLTHWEIEFKVHAEHRGTSLKHGAIAAWLRRQRHIEDAQLYVYEDWLDRHTTPEQRPTREQFLMIDEAFGANWRKEFYSAREADLSYAFPGRANPDWVTRARSVDYFIRNQGGVEALERFEIDDPAWPYLPHLTVLKMFDYLFDEDRTPRELRLIEDFEWWSAVKEHYETFLRDKDEIYARRDREQQEASRLLDEQILAEEARREEARARWIARQPEREANNRAAELAARENMRDIGCRQRAEQDASCHCQSPTYKRDRERIARRSEQAAR